VQPVRAAIVGVGKIARDHHLPSIRANAAFTLVAAASRNATVEGVANYRSIEEMLQGSPEIEAVSICTPPQSHYLAARAALLRGKHVLMEKPPCASIAQLDALGGLANKTGRTLYQTWHSQYARAVPEAVRLLQARRLVSAQITWKENAHKWHAGQDWLWEAGGFGVLDCGINALSVMTKLVQEPIFPLAARLLVPQNAATPVAADLDLMTDAGVPIAAVFDYRHSGPEIWTISLQTDSGPVLLYAGANAITQSGEPSSWPAVTLAHEYQLIYRRFAELIRSGESEVDSRPLELVADIFMMAETVHAPSFTT